MINCLIYIYKLSLSLSDKNKSYKDLYKKFYNFHCNFNLKILFGLS
jgi:hypothetical protein